MSSVSFSPNNLYLSVQSQNNFNSGAGVSRLLLLSLFALGSLARTAAKPLTELKMVRGNENCHVTKTAQNILGHKLALSEHDGKLFLESANRLCYGACFTAADISAEINDSQLYYDSLELIAKTCKNNKEIQRFTQSIKLSILEGARGVYSIGDEEKTLQGTPIEFHLAKNAYVDALNSVNKSIYSKALQGFAFASIAKKSEEIEIKKMALAQIPEKKFRDEEYRKLVSDLALKNRCEEANVFAEKIDFECSRYQTFDLISQMCKKQPAGLIASQKANHYFRSDEELLKEIKKLLEAKNYSEAIQTAQHIDNDDLYFEIIETINTLFPHFVFEFQMRVLSGSPDSRFYGLEELNSVPKCQRKHPIEVTKGTLHTEL